MSGVVLLVGEQKNGESKNAIIACNDYLRMGVGRSFQKLCSRYQAASDAPPTKRLKTLADWSRRFGWQDRADAYDKQGEAEKNTERREVFQSGLALEHERVRELTALYAKLKEELDIAGIKYTDTKMAASGATVDVEVFNKPLIDSLRAVLDDIAKETGGRRQRTVAENIDYTKLTDAQLARIAAGEDPMQVILSDYSSAND